MKHLLVAQKAIPNAQGGCGPVRQLASGELSDGRKGETSSYDLTLHHNMRDVKKKFWWREGTLEEKAG